jgi:hypothetical protein
LFLKGTNAVTIYQCIFICVYLCPLRETIPAPPASLPLSSNSLPPQYHLSLFFTIYDYPNPVRRAAAILLLLVFTFNVIGYYGIYWYARNHYEAIMLQKLDADNYASYQSITLKIPLSLPYQLNSDNADFERINGSFQYKGEFYKLVKQKMKADTLYVVCVKDHEEKRLQTTMSDFMKISNDIPSHGNVKVLGAFVKDFEETASVEIITDRNPILHKIYISYTDSLLNLSLAVLSPPPEFLQG